MSEITIENLEFTYPDASRALDGISFSVGKAEKLGIIGPNGAGKSTLVNHFNGFFLPQTGKIVIHGIDLSKSTQEEIRKNVGIVFQNPDDQLFMTRLFDDVAFGLKNLGTSPETVKLEVQKILKELGLWELRDKPAAHISQGQKRFAAFASVLVMSPSIIVLDEPTSDLDPRNRKKLIALVKGFKSTCVTVSHDLDFIWDTCERVILLSAGKIVAEGKTEKILSDKMLLEKNGLELPIRLQSNL